MFNHHRGLWGYTGTAPDGEPVTIQATGMGGPSAAIVLSELISLGARRAIRVGTCGALSAGARARRPGHRRGGDLRRRYLAGARRGRARRLPTEALADGLARAAPGAHAGTVVSVDLFYEDRAARRPAGRARRRDGGGRSVRARADAAMPGRPACWWSPTPSRRDGERARIADERCSRPPSAWAGRPSPPCPSERRSCSGGFRLGARRFVRLAGAFFAGGRLGLWLCAAGAGSSLVMSVRELLLDRARRASTPPGTQRPVQAVHAVLDSLEAVGDRPQPPVSRSMSAADGMLSAPNATSWACEAFSRASNARAERPGQERVFEQVREGLAEPLLGCAAEALAQAFGGIARVGHPLLLIVGSGWAPGEARVRPAAEDPDVRIRCSDAPAALRLRADGVPVGPRARRRPLPDAGPARPRSPSSVVVLETLATGRRATVGARPRSRPATFRRGGRAGAGPRSGARRSRVTIVDPVPLSAEVQARSWLEDLDASNATCSRTWDPQPRAAPAPPRLPPTPTCTRSPPPRRW